VLQIPKLITILQSSKTMTNFNTQNKKTIVAISFAALFTVTLMFAQSSTIAYAGEPAFPAAPFCNNLANSPVIATIYKKFPGVDSSNTWVTPGGDVEMKRLNSGGFDGWEVKASPGETNDVVVGSHLNDLIHGGKGHDVLCGDDPRISITGVGDDELRGGKGNDAIWGTYPNAATDGSAFDTDTLKGGHGDDKLWGQDGPDTLEGGHGADTLICSDGGPDGDLDTVKGGHDDDTDLNCLTTGPDFDDVDLGKGE